MTSPRCHNMHTLQKILFGSETILYDLEYTAWDGSKETDWSRAGEYREIVEIGAIKITPSPAGLMVIDRYSRLVRPQRNPTLSDYFTQLTGITQDNIDSQGVEFAVAFQGFVDFVGASAPLLSFGYDDEILMENLALNHIASNLPASRFMNYRAPLCAALKISPDTNSADLPKAINIPHESDQHRAIGDTLAQLTVLNYALKQNLLMRVMK